MFIDDDPGPTEEDQRRIDAFKAAHDLVTLCKTDGRLLTKAEIPLVELASHEIYSANQYYRRGMTHSTASQEREETMFKEIRDYAALSRQ